MIFNQFSSDYNLIHIIKIILLDIPLRILLMGK